MRIGIGINRQTSGGFNPKSLLPIFWIKDTSIIVDGKFIDSSGNNHVLTAATTTVANDSIILAANDTSIINALKLARAYWYFYTNDATPKTVLLSSLNCCYVNTLYFNKFQNKNLLLFSDYQPESTHAILLNYLKLTATYTVLDNEIFNGLGDWTLSTGGTIVNSKLHLVSSGAANKKTIWIAGEILKITMTGVTIAGKLDVAIGNWAVFPPTENSLNQNYVRTSSSPLVINNIPTNGMTGDKYTALWAKTPETTNTIDVTSIKVERVIYHDATPSLKEIFDGIYDNSIIYEDGTPSAKSEYSFYTDATVLTVSAIPTIYVGGVYGFLQVLINDVLYSYTQFTVYVNNQVKEITIPAGNKKVTIITDGLTRLNNAGRILGTFIDSIKIPNANSYTKFIQGTITEKYLFLCDSIGNGSQATHLQEGFANLFKTTNNKEVGIWGWGWARLADAASTQAKIDAFIIQMNAFFANCTGRKVLVNQLGTNDAGQAGTAAATFTTWDAALLDAIHAADPTIEIFRISPFYADGETSLWADYRTGISGNVTDRAAWGNITYINGVDCVAYNTSNYYFDGVHLKTAGQLAVHDYIDGIIL